MQKVVRTYQTFRTRSLGAVLLIALMVTPLRFQREKLTKIDAYGIGHWWLTMTKISYTMTASAAGIVTGTGGRDSSRYRYHGN